MEEAAGSITDTAPVALIPALEVARQTPLQESPNGIRFATYAETGVTPADLTRLIQAIPVPIASALRGQIFYFVPLAMAEGRDTRRNSENGPADTLISPAFTQELAEFAICHRNVGLTAGLNPELADQPAEGIFISARLLPDRFSLAFEIYINAAHAFVDAAGVSEPFSELVWAQAVADVRGESSQDAWEHRAAALPSRHSGQPSATQPDEQAKSAYLEAAFSDAVAIYLLSLATDFDYSELREREYPLLAPGALAARLRHVNRLFPPNPAYEFAIRYRRRG